MKKTIILSKDVYEKLNRLTKSSGEIENGGLLYGRVNAQQMKVYDISEAGPLAYRSRSEIHFDLEYLQQYTKEQLAEHYYVLGTWHTHPPDSLLHASKMDKDTMKTLAAHYPKDMNPIFIISNMKAETFNYKVYTVSEDKIEKIPEYYLNREGG